MFGAILVRVWIVAIAAVLASSLADIVFGGGVQVGSTALAQPAPLDAGASRAGASWAGAALAGASWHEKTSVDVEPSAEGWIGFEGYRRVSSLYAGSTWSPFANLRQDGFRVRVIGGQSLYRYSGDRYDPAIKDSALRQFSGTARFLDIFLGWQLAAGETTVKIFGGYEAADHAIAPYDPETRIQGRAGGLKAMLELWHNWTPEVWTSIDLAGSQVHANYSAQVRWGRRMRDGWSFGPEGSVIGHTETTIQRLGLFMRYENLAHEFTIAGGAGRARGDVATAYATAQYLRRF